jgi:hypothetical protein
MITRLNKRIMKRIFFFAIAFGLTNIVIAQQSDRWTEKDRQYLLENLKATKDELIKETSGLSKKQWDFKESPDRWSIRQIAEHIALWEFILQREISVGIALGPDPVKAKKTPPDSNIANFILEEKKHLSNDYTYPFTYSQPMGTNSGSNNVLWFLKMRNESIEYITKAKENLREYFTPGKSTDIHQRFITTFGHCARHVRQIKNVKLHPDYPKS